MRVRGASPAALFQLSSIARRAFDLEADPGLIAAVLGADPLLAPLIRRRPGLRIPGIWNPFECAVRAIIGQGLSAEAERTFTARVVMRFGHLLSSEGSDHLTHLFPAAAALRRARFERLGISGPRAKALRALARTVELQDIDFSAPVRDVTNALASIAGVGESIAQYVALRALGEPDALPSDDPVLERRTAGGSSPAGRDALIARAGVWRPWRSYAAMHLWCAWSDRRAARSRSRRTWTSM